MGRSSCCRGAKLSNAWPAVVCTLLSIPLARRTTRAFAGACTIVLSIIGCVMLFAVPASHPATRYGGCAATYLCR